MPIEQITPGTQVLAADPVSGVWSFESMLDQWSHVDVGRLVTAVLVDGSEITATDDHLFWVDSDGAWVELDDVGPGDLLLTPDGVATVAHVVVWPQANQLVWELDTAGPDTFTVSTGTNDVLVHNCNAEGDIGGWDQRDGNGLSRREHVERHNNDIPDRDGPHGVFADDAVETVDKAWEKAIEMELEGVVQPNGNIRYEVPYPDAGLQGGNPDLPGHGDVLDTVTIVVKPPNNDIITAFPS